MYTFILQISILLVSELFFCRFYLSNHCEHKSSVSNLLFAAGERNVSSNRVESCALEMKIDRAD